MRFVAPAYPMFQRDFIYSLATDRDDIKMACYKARRHRLAVNGWVFFEVFKAGLHNDTSQYVIDKMSMAYSNEDGKAVGCAVAFHAWGDLNAGCFVRDSHRRMGLGTQLIEQLLRGESRAVRIHDGVVGSKDFWKAMGANDLGYIRE